MTKTDDTERRARTRLLIQLGSLINLAGLSLLCDIEEGDDLQLDIGSRDKAALLLGILLDIVADFAPTDAQKERLIQAGIR
ncbi:MAG: conjugal transfer protein TraD, partial [Alphaproteobacteria bacterium]